MNPISSVAPPPVEPGPTARASGTRGGGFSAALGAALGAAAAAEPAEKAGTGPLEAGRVGGAGRPGAAEAEPAADADVVQAGLTLLDPLFRAPLQRVIARLEKEGHSVEVVETVRSQARQDALFAQGRTLPGPVVTWTRDSSHRVGRAADLRIDGGTADARTLQRLAQIAAEEGLHTLGPLDPGHVELPRDAASTSRAAAAGYAPGTGQTAAVSGSRGGSGVAEVAAVAPVAPLARVAQVAPLAVVAGAAGAAGADPQGTAAGERRGSEPRGRTAAPPAHAQGAAAGELPAWAAPPADAPARAAAITTAGTAVGSSPAEHVARILALKDAPSTAPLNHLLLRVDNGTGGEDRIRVDLRGAGLHASIQPADAADAGRLSSRLPELERALQLQGFQPQALRVHPADPPTGVAGLVKELALDGGLLRAPATTGSQDPGFQQRERPAPGQEKQPSAGGRDARQQTGRHHKGKNRD